MSMTDTGTLVTRRSLRLWPGILAATVLVLLRFVAPLLFEDLGAVTVIGAVVCGLAVVAWWLFFSRAPWIERLGAVALIAVAILATRLLIHPSIAGGMMGMMLPVVAVPMTLPVLFVLWAVATRRLSDPVRRITMVITILAGVGVWTLARTDGISGQAGVQLAWRWTPTPEERLLARGEETPAPPAPAPQVQPPAPDPAVAATRDAVEPPRVPVQGTPAATETSVVSSASAPAVRSAWPGFRGPARDGVIRNLRITTDWATTPPTELWRRPVGPGWSSFAVAGDLIYTQEQRGEDEIVSAYRFSNGQPVWKHKDPVRFYESNGGAGPRATPTVHAGRVYALGATGILNALDARTGARIWTRNAQTDTGAALPGWGFAGSPLVVNDLLVVATSGRLAAYDIATGAPRWTRATGGGGYSSPHLANVDGVEQILLLNGGGIAGVSPADGSILWQQRGTEGVSIVQPALDGADILVAGGDMMGGTGLRRIGVSKSTGTWTAEERWTSRGLKPYFNDFVLHEGHAYGFDGTILSCVSLADGERKWKGGRYGSGQMILLPEQDLLLVLSEEGELALVQASPDKHTEIAKFKAIEGKTWNHPVLVGDVLLVRNGEEMAAFRLARARD